jgi:hypothetical protein|nr:MAG TPA: hypothetical protein [Caudoviricetes sp.]
MLELKSCKITRREKRGDASNMFTVHIAYYDSTFVDENKEEYFYPSQLIYVNKVPSLVDCLNDTISVFYNKDALIPIHKKHVTFIEICNMIGSRYFDLYINGTLYKRCSSLNDVNCICSFLKKNGLFVYDVTQSLTAPSEYNLLVEKEFKTC